VGIARRASTVAGPLPAAGHGACRPLPAMHRPRFRADPDACILLRAGVLRADVRPGIGGSLAGFWTEGADGTRHDWLRPADPGSLARADPLGMSSFPLLPWCNRIRDGVLHAAGRSWRLAPLSVLPHALHGLGWRLPWDTVASGASWVELRLRHPAGPAWPFDFEAQQR
jgi:aldose 1-epimerase